nr:PKD domain-containing protein [Streptomyces sp. 846.5]
MPRPRALIAILAAALLAGGLGATTAHADTASTDIYVNSGSATCTDSGIGALTAPFCSLQVAVDAALPGQTVHVRKASETAIGTGVVISHSGEPSKPITVDGGVNHNRGTAVELKATAGTTPLSITGAHDIVLTRVNLEGLGTKALNISGASDITVDSSVAFSALSQPLTDSTPPVDVISIDGSSHDVSITRTQAHGVLGTDLDIQSGASAITLADDDFNSYANAGAVTGGVRADGVSGMQLAGNTFAPNCSTALSITGASSGSVENSVIQSMSPGPCKSSSPTAGVSVGADSVANIHSDYNYVSTWPSPGARYVWADTSFATAAAFNSATGQAAHDTQVPSPDPNLDGRPNEHSPMIDSGDATAPGELATDYDGRARVDDPLVANTGTGSGIVDRGAFEFQDPGGSQTASLTDDGVDYTKLTYPLDVTFFAGSGDAWFTGPYLFDFGDGSAPVSSTSSRVEHIYTEPPTDGGNTFTATVSQPVPPGTAKTSTTFRVPTDGPPAVKLLPGSDPNNPGGYGVSISTTSAWPVTGVTVDFGDGTGIQKVDWPSGAPGQPTSMGDAGHEYAAPGSYTIKVTATDSHGHTTATTTTARIGAYFVPVPPKRLLDTRAGDFRKLGPGQSLTFIVSKNYVMSPADMNSVTFNLTATNATAASYITAYSDDHTRPSTSNLNFLAGQTATNQVTVPVDKNGWVTLYNRSGYVDLIADAEGYFTLRPLSDTEGGYSTPIGPTRLLDTRSNPSSPTVGPGSVTTVHLPSTLGSSGTVLLNVTAAQATATTYVTAYPATGSLPGTSLLNLGRGQTRSNLVAVSYDASHTVRMYNAAGRVALIADVEGYYAGQGSTSDSQYVPLSPTRILDTRNGTGTAKHQVGPGTVVRVKVTGSQGVPNGATAVAINLTGTNATKGTYLATYSGGTTPTASNLNLLPGESRPIQAIVPVDSSGYITVYNSAGSVDVIADLEGYYALPQ